MSKRFLLFSLVFLLFVVPLVSATNVSNCINITTDGNYTLTANIVNTASLKCINISADNVVFDCNGYLIDGVDTTDSFGVYMNERLNVNTKNCVITDFEYGIFLAYTNYAVVTNNNVSSMTSHGIALFPNSSYNNITDNIAYDNGVSGILLELYNDYNLIKNNVAYSNGLTGQLDTGYNIGEGTSSYNIFTNNTVWDSQEGFRFDNSGSYNNVSFNTIFDVDKGLYVISHAEHNNFFNNSVTTRLNNTGLGVYLRAEPNYFWNNSFNNTNQISSASFVASFNYNFWANPNGSGYSQNCTNANSDAFCDNHYDIDAYNIDNYPLTLLNSSSGCGYNNPVCGGSYDCINNSCVLKSGCAYSNPDCDANYVCSSNNCVLNTPELYKTIILSEVSGKNLTNYPLVLNLSNLTDLLSCNNMKVVFNDTINITFDLLQSGTDWCNILTKINLTANVVNDTNYEVFWNTPKARTIPVPNWNITNESAIKKFFINKNGSRWAEIIMANGAYQSVISGIGINNSNKNYDTEGEGWIGGTISSVNSIIYNFNGSVGIGVYGDVNTNKGYVLVNRIFTDYNGVRTGFSIVNYSSSSTDGYTGIWNPYRAARTWVDSYCLVIWNWMKDGGTSTGTAWSSYTIPNISNFWYGYSCSNKADTLTVTLGAKLLSGSGSGSTLMYGNYGGPVYGGTIFTVSAGSGVYRFVEFEPQSNQNFTTSVNDSIIALLNPPINTFGESYYSCIPNLTNATPIFLSNVSCLSSDFMNQSWNITTYDINVCGGDNVTTTFYSQNTSCNYCSFSVVNSTGSWNNISCVFGDLMNQTRNITEYDENYEVCYAVTNLSSDLWNSGNNNTYIEYRLNGSCDWCVSDLQNTSWTNWSNEVCLNTGFWQQSRTLIQFDLNNCSDYANFTYSEYNSNSSNCTSGAVTGGGEINFAPMLIIFILALFSFTLGIILKQPIILLVAGVLFVVLSAMSFSSYGALLGIIFLVFTLLSVVFGLILAWS